MRMKRGNSGALDIPPVFPVGSYALRYCFNSPLLHGSTILKLKHGMPQCPSFLDVLLPVQPRAIAITIYSKLFQLSPKPMSFLYQTFQKLFSFSTTSAILKHH